MSYGVWNCVTGFAVAKIKQDLADIINKLPTIIPASEEGE